MPRSKILSTNFNLVLVLIVISFSAILQTSYGYKEIIFTKTVDVRDQVLLAALSDVKKYPEIFPEYIRSAQLTGDNTAKFNVGTNGIFFDVETQYSNNSDGIYVIDVISGDLKGSRIITSLQKTWGFDGTPDSGTAVTMKIVLQTSGMLSFFAPSIPDDMIIYNLETSLEKFVSYAKSMPVQPATQETISTMNNVTSDSRINDRNATLEIQEMVKTNLTNPQNPNSWPSELPTWFKTNAGWWMEGKISDKDFETSIQYLISSKIIDPSALES